MSKKIKYLWNLAKKLELKENWRSAEVLYKVLIDLKQALLKGNYYTMVTSVARSGMSRIIIIGYIKNNKWHRITTPTILNLAAVDKNGRIHGCGMDMLFVAQYNLFIKLCPNHRYQNSMPNYKSL